MHIGKTILLYAGLASLLWGQGRVTVSVPANRAWNRTGITVDRGGVVVIDASGQIEAASDADTRAFVHHVPPEGRERQDNKPQPHMRSLVMLARIGDGPVIEAGAHAEFTADRSGELQLGINDDQVNDNSGAWNAQVSVRAGTTSATQQRGSGRNQDISGSGGGQSSRNDSTPNYQDQGQRDAGSRQYNDAERNRYRPEDQYRPDYRGSDYYRRYGHGFEVDEAVRICQQSVLTQAARRFRTNDIHFHRTAIDDNPGRNDWVTGTLDIHRGPRDERFGFSCSVDFDSGRLRSTTLDSRPLVDDPRWR